MTEFMANPALMDPAFDYNDLAAECQKTNSYLDEVYMFSNMYTFLALTYRQDWYDAAGLKPPATWKELYEQAAHFTRDDKYGYIIHGQRTAMMEMVTLAYLSMGGTVFDDYLHPTFSHRTSSRRPARSTSSWAKRPPPIRRAISPYAPTGR